MQDNPVAFLQIGDALRERPNCQRIRPQEHLAVAPANNQRRSTTGAKQGFRLPRHKDGQGIGPVKLVKHGLEGIL